MKKALITGITGQDGSYLAELLLQKGYQVYGIVRRSSSDSCSRLSHVIHHERLHLMSGNMRDIGSLSRIIQEVLPDEIYNLAAQSHVGVSFSCPEETWEVNYHGLAKLIHAAMDANPAVKIYQASTSEMFGSSLAPQSESTPFQPLSPYAEAKTKAYEDFVVHYREKHQLFICSGILFNHESPRRGEQFVTRKITLSLAKIVLGMQEYFELGNLDSRRDWGFAGDYVEAMWLMLQQSNPTDYVIGMGKSYSVRDFVHAAAQALGMSITWEGQGIHEVAKDEQGRVIVRISEQYYRPTDPHDLISDPTKALQQLGWSPKTSFDELVRMMVASDLEYIKKQ